MPCPGLLRRSRYLQVNDTKSPGSGVQFLASGGHEPEVSTSLFSSRNANGRVTAAYLDIVSDAKDTRMPHGVFHPLCYIFVLGLLQDSRMAIAYFTRSEERRVGK